MSAKIKVALVVAVIGLLGGTVTAYAAATHQTSNVYTFSDMEDVGDAKLTRNDSGVTFTLKTTELDPGAAYTVWWVVFNNPESCDNGCDEPDLFDPEVEAGVFFATGHVIGNNGKGNFGARLNENTLPSGPGQVPFAAFGVDNPLLDSMKAEVHLVVRSHGQPVPGMVNHMISTFGGGCTPATDPSGEGPEGPNECEDVQFAIFPAP